MTFSIWYVSSVSGQAYPFDSGFTRRQLREAFASFRFLANSQYRFARAWVLKRGKKTIVRRPA